MDIPHPSTLTASLDGEWLFNWLQDKKPVHPYQSFVIYVGEWALLSGSALRQPITTPSWALSEEMKQTRDWDGNQKGHSDVKTP